MSKAMIAVDKSGSYRVYVTVTTDLVQEAVSIHDTTPVASAALGRVLTAAGLMGIMLKSDEDKLTVNFKGNGQARQILTWICLLRKMASWTWEARWEKEN